MIILEATAGLANRMRAVDSALALAKKYQTELIVIWPMDSALNCEFRRLFAPIEGVRFVCCKPLSIRSIRIMCKLLCKHSFIGARRKDMGQIVAAISGGGSVFISSFSAFYPSDGFVCFRPVDSVLEKVRAILPKNCSNLVGIHIRRTDNEKSIMMSPTDLFVHAIQAEIQNNSAVQFYLATDSMEEQQRLVSAYGSRIIVNTEKTLSRVSTQGIVDALVDLMCLSRSAKIYGSYWSSFSETAAALGKTELIILQNELV